MVIGSCRSLEDEKLLEKLQSRAQELNIDDHVEFKKNIPWDQLYAEMQQAMVGIHTMQDEHFGIAVVEFMVSTLRRLIL